MKAGRDKEVSRQEILARVLSMDANEADRIIAEKVHNWHIQAALDPVEDMDDQQWYDDENHFVCFVSEFHPSRDLNQLHEAVEELPEEIRLRYMKRVGHKLHIDPRGYMAHFAFHHAPAEVCAVSLAETVKGE